MNVLTDSPIRQTDGLAHPNTEMLVTVSNNGNDDDENSDDGKDDDVEDDEDDKNDNYDD